MNTKSFDRDGNREFLADKRIAIIVADFYKDIADKLLNSSIETIKLYGCKASNIDIYRLPGAFEIPVAISRNINKYDGFIALGSIIKGETPNFDFISSAITNGLMNFLY